MKLSELIKGNRVLFQIDYTNSVHEFNSVVLGSRDEGIILSDIKIGGRSLRLPEKDGINIIFQVFNTLYIWKNVRVESLNYKGKLFYRVRDVEQESKLYNRRGGFRLPIDSKCDIDIFSGRTKTTSNCYIDNVSESGFCFSSLKDLEYGTKIGLRYGNEDNIFDMAAFIIRKTYDSEKGIFKYGCKMPEFNENMSAFIMKEQIRRRRVSA